MPISSAPSPAAQTLWVRKAADEARQATTSTSADSELTLALAANCHYEFEVFVLYDSSTTADFKATMAAPAGATTQFTSQQPASSVASLPGAAQAHKVYAAGDVSTPGAPGAATKTAMTIKGICRVGATAGNLSFNWAQNASELADTKVLADSYIKAVKVYPLG
jgi:hypothetical protein